MAYQTKNYLDGALHYHANPRPIKISVTPSRHLPTNVIWHLPIRLALLVPCLEIEKTPKAALYTALLAT